MEAIGPRLQGLDPDLGYEPKVNGSLFRINRDTRFSQDKRPYKSELGFRFWAGTDRKAPRSSLFMRITPAFVGFGAGVWMFEPPALTTYRQAVGGAPGAELAAAMTGLNDHGCRVYGEGLKRVPAAWPQDHPRADLLKRKGLVVGLDEAHPAELTTPGVVDWCVARFERMLPVHRWLEAHVGA